MTEPETCGAEMQLGGRVLRCALPPHEHGHHQGDWDGNPVTWPRGVDRYGRLVPEQRPRRARD